MEWYVDALFGSFDMRETYCYGFGSALITSTIYTDVVKWRIIPVLQVNMRRIALVSDDGKRLLGFDYKQKFQIINVFDSEHYPEIVQYCKLEKESIMKALEGDFD